MRSIPHIFDLRVLLQRKDPRDKRLELDFTKGQRQTSSRELGMKDGTRSNAKCFTGMIFSSQVV